MFEWEDPTRINGARENDHRNHGQDGTVMYVFPNMLLIRQTRATMISAGVGVEALQLLRCVVLRIGNPIFGPMTALLFEAYLACVGAEPMGALDRV